MEDSDKAPTGACCCGGPCAPVGPWLPQRGLGSSSRGCPAFQQCIPRHSATSSFGNIWVVSWGQNRPQETPLVCSQRGKVARGKTHKPNTLWVVNTCVRHLLKAIYLESFYCYTGIGAVPVNKEITNQAPRGRHYQQRTCVCLSWNHTPGLPWQGGWLMQREWTCWAEQRLQQVPEGSGPYPVP